MSVQMVLLPVFVLVGLYFLPAAVERAARGRNARRGQRGTAASELTERRPDRQLSTSSRSVLFYVLIAIALPLRKTDLVMVMLSWVFVVTRFAHAGIFVTSSECRNALAGLVRRRACGVCDVGLLRDARSCC